MTEQATTPLNLLFILSGTPYGNSNSLEFTDAILTAAAFDFQVQVLVMGAGVWQLCQGQDATAINQKPFVEVLKGLSWYDIDQIWVAEQALQQQGVDDAQLIDNCQQADASQIKQLMQQATYIFHG